MNWNHKDCTHGDCIRPRANGTKLCGLHLQRARKGQDMDAPPKRNLIGNRLLSDWEIEFLHDEIRASVLDGISCATIAERHELPFHWVLRCKWRMQKEGRLPPSSELVSDFVPRNFAEHAKKSRRSPTSVNPEW